MIYMVIISCTCGCEWRLSCMPSWQVSLSLCLGNGASPRGPKFGISILCANGPPFAACHHKMGGFVLARDPPAERGPVFPLCSMTPLILSVHFLLLCRPPCRIPALCFSSSRNKNPIRHHFTLQQKSLIWLFVGIYSPNE